MKPGLFQLPKQILLALAFLAGLVGIGTVGYMLLEGATFMDSLFMTVITISTVGYDETIPVLRPLTRWFTIGLIFIGIGFFFWVVNDMAQLTVHRQIQSALGRRSMQKSLDGLSNHFILCGYGRMGRAVTDFMAAKNESFVVIEHDESRRDELLGSGWPFLIGDATDEATLEAAGIDRARGLIAATGSDPVNVYITLTARAQAPELFIVARADEEPAERKLTTAGADRVVSVYRHGAQRVANTLLRPAVVNFMDLAGSGRAGELQIEQVMVQPGSELDGTTAAEAKLRNRFGVFVIAIQNPDGQIRFNPAADMRIAAHDVLVVLGTAEHLEMLGHAVSAPAGQAAPPAVD